MDALQELIIGVQALQTTALNTGEHLALDPIVVMTLNTP